MYLWNGSLVASDNLLYSRSEVYWKKIKMEFQMKNNKSIPWFTLALSMLSGPAFCIRMIINDGQSSNLISRFSIYFIIFFSLVWGLHFLGVLLYFLSKKIRSLIRPSKPIDTHR